MISSRKIDKSLYPTTPVHRTQKLAITALMASLALAFSILKLEAPYPVLPYLKFDLAEVPATFAYFMCGLSCGLLAEALHFAGLVARGSEPLGAFMKFLAVSSMLVGSSVVKAVSKNIVLEFLGASTTRVAVMTIINWVYFTLLYPGFLSYAVKMAGGLILVYVYTAVFNLVHTVFSLGVAYAVYREVERRIEI
ncbi:hypothetical protein IG193_03175 [Infirmifilum lucidum]|uniref:ECF transporter S component n=1 Tax=Infirmifilum lucidum TaxID=2776706 RepID=A0A7L9FIE6_9CREN|nr:ECF transporter S component [Infirmifilum lucidum]QOJ79477.1 hypothetical protein IG193_03175 [Infirmifilum lucidum]